MYMKTIERAHTPANLWERVKLKKNFEQALEQLNTHLVHWPRYMVQKVKQRLVKIRQYLIRMRRLKLRAKTKLVTVNKKVERREASREQKAEIAAQLDNAIKKEILARFQSNTYPEDIHNFNPALFQKALEDENAESDAEEDEEEPEVETVEEFIEEDDDLEDGEFADMNDEELLASLDDDEDDDEDEGSDEGEGTDKKRKLPAKEPKKKPTKEATSKAKRRPARGAGPKRARVELEYEHEEEMAPELQF